MGIFIKPKAKTVHAANNIIAESSIGHSVTVIVLIIPHWPFIEQFL